MLSPIDIKISLLRAGINGAQIARKAGVDRTAIYHTIAGRRRSKRLRKAIAEALGIRVTDIWPDRWAARDR